MFQEGAVKAREMLCVHLAGQLESHVVFNFWTKFQSHELPRAHPQAMGHVVLGDDQIIASVIFASNDNMSVGLASVVVINGYPIQFGFKVTLDLGHEVTDEGFQIMELCAVLR
jgi:hypothetical protein